MIRAKVARAVVLMTFALLILSGEIGRASASGDDLHQLSVLFCTA